jgi:UDP-3-O-[3-hydroxymyristoyl] glucosamine N-acyltransferase
MSHRIEDIAKALDAQAEGDLDLVIRGAAEPASAGVDDLALAMDPKYAEGLTKGAARAAVLWAGADWRALGLKAAIFVPRPRYAMSSLTRVLDPGPEIAPGIHSSCVIDPSAEIGEGAAIGPFVVIGRGARIGARARIASHVSIAEGAVIGADALILNGARIMARVVIGDRFIGLPGCVIGADGFSFVTPQKSGAEQVRETLGSRTDMTAQSWTRIHSLGAVRLGDDVEIGANTTIDRGTIRDTSVGSGTKLDDQVHIGHNVQIGRDCLLCGQVGIAGSVRIGDRVVLGGRTAVSDNLFIGDDVVAGGGTGIGTNVPAGRVIWGSPAMKMELQMEVNKGLRRLPRLYAQVAELQKVVLKLTKSD